MPDRTVEMSVARLRALTHLLRTYLGPPCPVEMSVARLRALTHRQIHIKVPLCVCRNECGPFEGIDTCQRISAFTHHSLVEMSVARLRALTHAGHKCHSNRGLVEMSVARLRALTPHTFLHNPVRILVEMSVARLRALTPHVIRFCGVDFLRRNECGPFEGIDT